MAVTGVLIGGRCRFGMWLRKYKCLAIQLVTILFLISKKTVISTEYYIDVNQRVNIQESMCAIVPCKFVADSRQKFINTKGLWMQGRSIVASSDPLEGTKQNFHVIGNPDDGDCTLKIDNARKEDGGTYVFRFEQSKDGLIKYTYNNKPITVQVIDIREIDGLSIQLIQTVTVHKGLCFTIPCTFTADYKKSFTNSRGHWKTTCKEFVASSDKSIVGIKPNFHLMGNPDNGDCTLKITDANEQDSGRYYFSFENAGDAQRFSYAYKIVTVKVTDIEEVDGYSIQLNQTVVVQEGLCVTIPCTFTADYMNSFNNSQGHWSTICHELVASSNKSIVGINPNFQLIGNPDNGDCTLMITDANEQDSGMYYFRFEGAISNQRHSYESKMITIKVTELNERPVISDPGILTEGNKVTLTCNAPRGCPNALITWHNQTEIETNATDLTFIPTRNHHQTSLTCRMSFAPSKNYTQNEIILSVQYPPSIIITIKTSELTNMTNEEELTNMTNEEVTVQEGSSLVLNCSVESNTGAQVTWMKGEKNVLSKANGRELMLYLNNITASGADKYLCLAQNNVGASNQTISIVVKYSTPTNFNMIAWITVNVIVILILIGLGIFCFVRYVKNEESGQQHSLGLTVTEDPKTGTPSLSGEETSTSTTTRPPTTTTTGSHRISIPSQAGSHVPARPEPQLLSSQLAAMMGRLDDIMEAVIGRGGAGSASSEPDRERGPIYEVLSDIRDQHADLMEQQRQQHAQLMEQQRQQHAEVMALMTEHVAAFQQNAGASTECEAHNSGGAA